MGAAALAMNIAALILYATPFLFMLLNSFKDRSAASKMNMRWPESFHPENYLDVIQASGGVLPLAFKNSFILTVSVVAATVVICSMTAFYIQRRDNKTAHIASGLLMMGLMVPVAVMPSIWVLQTLGLFRSKLGLIFIQIAIGMPFSMMLYRGFIASVPREIDEAAEIDGCGTARLFFQVIFPILKPVTATVIILSSINVFNDFSNALYFLPGSGNATVQLTLYNFMGAYSNRWNLVFADVVIICVPMVILFLLFNKQIVAGMTAGSVKG
ncbi:MAG: carbohydrate ABC transporter permease [Clostridia bacterium]|nr:carbohydrate ABC transporter permease [Clostridia bacterium]